MRRIKGGGMINIYRASAGAGKTHKLTGEYIKLLFSQPYAYKHILAVTFTNKATDEMKQRILQELYHLSEPGRRSDYLSGLMEVYGKEEAWIRGEAKRILIAILHDYSSFSISTIDKFFQTVMRAFAREMGKIATYNVELDRDGVLSQAIDRMFSELDRPENNGLLKWLIDYSLEAVDAGNSWNIRREIFDLAKEIFSEDFKLKKRLHSGNTDLSGRGDILVLKGKIKEITGRFEQELRRLGAEGVACMERCGVSYADFKGGSRSPFKYFHTLSGITAGSAVEPPKAGFKALYDNITGWHTGKSVPSGVEAAYSGGLNEAVGSILAFFEREYALYATAKVIAGNMNALGILDDIYRRVLAYCRERNIMLLSESTELLNRIIDGSDTPFIYEKIGARIDNFMLDEFQDTSVLQWRNFHPLLQNSLAGGNENLIVGDVKQSIYRWRGSDWNILNSRIFTEFRQDEINSCSLDCNWRSGKNIVDFNNGFFKFCAVTAQSLYNEKSLHKGDMALIEKIYSGFEQHVPPKGAEHPGYVEVNFMEPGEAGFESRVLEELPGRIRKLLYNGASQKDIAVLVRKKEQGREVARTLIEAGLDVISNDSLFVCSSFAVQKVVNFLRERENPDSPVLRIYRHFSAEYLPDGAEMPEMSLPAERLAGMSLYEMCEEIIRCCLSEQEKEEVAFLQSFLDSVLEYTHKEGTNLSQFLKWWDDCGQLKTISAPEDQDAVHIMTIHKAKGLGFKTVIIPFLKENLDRSGGRLWCNLPDPPAEGGTTLSFDAPIPVVYNSSLAGTVFSADYDQEKLSLFVDNLNTAYVAFTRAKEQLLIYSPYPRRNKEGEYTLFSIADILYRYYEKPGENIQQIVTGTPVLSSGKPLVAEKEGLGPVFGRPLDDSRTRTSLNSGSINDGTSIREYGIAMHYVFSLLKSASDIPQASRQAFDEGICECSACELETMVTGKLKAVESYGWFDAGNTVLNECDILKPDGNTVRPDRVIIRDGQAVVVDYKFGERTEENYTEKKYIRQVREYMGLLGEIGYGEVKGYIWYVESGEVVECGVSTL